MSEQYEKTFNSKYEQYRKHDKKKCHILRELDDTERDPEVGETYEIEFEDGTRIEAWPEELEEEYVILVPEIHYARYRATAVTPRKAFKRALDGETEEYDGLNYDSTMQPDEKPWIVSRPGAEEELVFTSTWEGEEA